ncbi:hypothetical protein ACTA71_012688 [Dictyostelium dimigraforme]
MNLEELFFKVWRNVYLNFQIFKHLILYTENKIMRFYSLKELRDYKNKEYIESLTYIGDEPLEVGDLTMADDFQVLKKVRIQKENHSKINPQFFNISPLLFPMGVEEIIYPFSNQYHSTILVGLPNSVKKVYNVFFTTEITADMIPISIETLLFSCFHDQRLLNGSIHSNIKELYMSGNNSGFELSEGDICDGVQYINMAGYSLQPHLTFKKGVLPNSITKLRIYHPNFTDQYNDEQLLIDRVIPTSVKSIVIEGMSGITLVKDFIPTSVTELFLMGSNILIKPLSIPSNLISLHLDRTFNTPINIGMLPSSLKEFTFSSSDIQFEHGSLPDGLEKFKNTYNCIMVNSDNRPDDDGWNQKIAPGFFPSSICKIDFGKSFNQEIQIGDLPIDGNLKILKFGRYFTQSIIPFSIPNTVTFLDLGESLTNPSLLPNSIPSSVTKLILSEGFVRSLQINSIPITVKELYYRGDTTPHHSLIPSSINIIKFKIKIK